MSKQSLLLGLLIACSCVVAGVNAAAQDVFSRSRRVGDTLYVSNTGSRDPQTGKHPDSIEASTRQVLRNVEEILKKEGFTFNDVVSSHVWITDLNKFGEMNKAYREVFQSEHPVRTTIQVSELPDESAVSIAVVAFQGKKQIVHPREGQNLTLPFSPGILVGDTLYISGQASVDPLTGKLIEGDFKAHVTQTLKNVEAILKAADMDFSNVVHANVFLTNPDDFGPMSEVYRTFTTQPRPARVPLGATRLPLDAPVEITMIAKRQKGKAILPPDMPPSDNYSRGFLVGDELYVAGIGSAQEAVEDRVNDCMERVRKIVEEAGLSLGNVVEGKIYLSDIKDLEAVNQAFRKHFPSEAFPALTTVAVANLPAKLKMMTTFVAARNVK